MQKKLFGFTLVEILVVVSIISVLIAVVYANFNGARQMSRDKVRQSSLKEVQLAIELYKSQNGSYPEPGCGATTGWVGPGPGSSFPACEKYIEGLVPEFMSALPVDPNQGDNPDRGFLYWVNPTRTAYKVLVWGTVEADLVTGYNHPFVRCPRDFGTNSCGAVPHPETYAVYSIGAEYK